MLVHLGRVWREAMSALESIPLLDLETWDEETDRKLNRYEYGLAHIAGHGIKDHLISDFYRVFREILDR